MVAPSKQIKKDKQKAARAKDSEIQAKRLAFEGRCDAASGSAPVAPALGAGQKPIATTTPPPTEAAPSTMQAPKPAATLVAVAASPSAPPPKAAASSQPQAQAAAKTSPMTPAKWEPSTWFWSDKSKDPQQISHAAHVDVAKNRVRELQAYAKTLCLDGLDIDVYPATRGSSTLLIEVRGLVVEVKEACRRLALKIGRSPVPLPPGIAPRMWKHTEDLRVKCLAPAYHKDATAEHAAFVAKREAEEQASNAVAAKARRHITGPRGAGSGDNEWSACHY